MKINIPGRCVMGVCLPAVNSTFHGFCDEIYDCQIFWFLNILLPKFWGPYQRLFKNSIPSLAIFSTFFLPWGCVDLYIVGRLFPLFLCSIPSISPEIFCRFIIIIMSCHRHGYPWPSLAIFPYTSSPLAGLQGCIPYPHIAAGCMFVLVHLLLSGHMWGTIGVDHLWAIPCFSSSLACLVRLTWIVFEVGSRWPYSWCFVGYLPPGLVHSFICVVRIFHYLSKHVTVYSR